jgi:NADPH:quinone reductase-like Zn-dependent oxidoreductase
MKLKPSVCLECISGDMTGDILEYMGFKSTVLLYGLLSDKPAGNINTIGFIGKAQTIESFLLNNYLANKTLTEYLEIVLKAETMYRNELKTKINARYGLHEITDAIQYYMKNQTAGKIILKPGLTPVGAKPTDPINLDKMTVFAKL